MAKTKAWTMETWLEDARNSTREAGRAATATRRAAKALADVLDAGDSRLDQARADVKIAGMARKAAREALADAERAAKHGRGKQGKEDMMRANIHAWNNYVWAEKCRLAVVEMAGA